LAQQPIDTKWKRRDIVRFATAMADMQAATGACDLLLAERPDPTDAHYWAYHTAAVNAYARPFTRMEPIGKLPDSVREILTPDERKLHAQLLHDRMTASAHSDLSAKPVLFVPGGATVGQSDAIAGEDGFIIPNTHWEFETWAAIRALTLRIAEHVEREAFRLVEEVYGDLALTAMFEIPID
jgi:hypothetical protein